MVAWEKILCYAENIWLEGSNSESLAQELLNTKQDWQSLSSASGDGGSNLFFD